MQSIQRFFGVLLLGVAIWLVAPLVPPPAEMLAWAALLIVTGIYLQAIAPSGGTFLTGSSAWKGDYVLAALRGEELRRLVFEKGRVVIDEPLLQGRYGRLRTVTEAPDGSLYVLTSNRDGRGTPQPGDDRILRVELPAP